MKLLKIFRRYNHILLMVFMSLLLVTFLIPEAVKGCGAGRGQNEPIGQAFGQTFQQQDLRRVSADMRVVDAFGRFLPRPALEPVDMLLLYEEAQRMGVRVSRDQAAGLVDRIEQLSPGMLGRLSAEIGYSTNAIYDAIASYLGVIEAQGIQSEAIIGTPARAEAAFRDASQEADVKLSVVSSDVFIDRVPEPTEEEVVAQLEAGRDRETAHTPDELKFGYRLGERVAVEYVTVDPAAIVESIRVNRREAEEQYNQAPSRYTQRVEVAAATQTSQPAPPRFENKPLTLDQAMDQVKADVREIKAAEAAQRLINDIERAARGPWASAGMAEDLYTIPPAGGGDVSFRELAERFGKTHPVEYHKTALLEAQDLVDLPGLGRASTTGSARAVPFSQLALRVKGLANIDKDDSGPRLNPMEPSPLLMLNRNVAGKNRAYQGFIFRVVQTAAAAPPDSIDAVRGKVVADLKLMRAHALAKQYAEQIAARAKEVGLDAALAEAAELKQIISDVQVVRKAQSPFNESFLEALGPFEPARPLTRQSFFIDRVGIAGPLAKKVFEMAETTPADSAVRHATLVQLTSPELKWVVAELLGVKPVYRGEFDQARVQVIQQLLRGEFTVFQQAWFDPENIRKRTGFVRSPSRGETDGGQ